MALLPDGNVSSIIFFMSKLEETFVLLLSTTDIPPPQREYKFARDIVGHGPGIRKRLKAAGLKDWRLDFAWPDLRIAIEIEGGVYTRGRHVRGKGYVNDIEKYNALTLDGWRLLRFASSHISSGYALEKTIEIFKEIQNA